MEMKPTDICKLGGITFLPPPIHVKFEESTNETFPGSRREVMRVFVRTRASIGVNSESDSTQISDNNLQFENFLKKEFENEEECKHLIRSTISDQFAFDEYRMRTY
jgi:hypothetical protein